MQEWADDYSNSSELPIENKPLSFTEFKELDAPPIARQPKNSLDTSPISHIGIYSMFGYSTREAAKELGISLPTLNKYIALKLIPVPPLTRVGGVKVRLWSDQDIERVRKLLPKIANGRKTRYQKKQSTTRGKQPAKQKRGSEGRKH